MCDQHIHHVYVVSDAGDRRPIDCIAQTDVLNFIMEQLKES
jgi:hypothetical protein